MARRKRLDPASPQLSASLRPAGQMPRLPAIPPVAEVAADASATAALSEMADTLRQARAQGRMILTLPLDQVDLDYLVRDRIPAEDEDMKALQNSLRQRRQQTPIEVVALENGRYGLISGWRRCQALRRVYQDTKDPKFETVLAVLRQHDQASDSYVAMVEENEIRSGLSFYERARIVARAVDNGVYETETDALRGLFGSVPRARRSKIKSFLRIVYDLDDVLRFPSALSEKLGLELAAALSNGAGFSNRLRDALNQALPETSEEELAFLRAMLARKQPPRPADAPDGGTGTQTVAPVEAAPGVFVHIDAKGRLGLSGKNVTPELHRDLLDWLAQRR